MSTGKRSFSVQAFSKEEERISFSGRMRPPQSKKNAARSAVGDSPTSSASPLALDRIGALFNAYALKAERCALGKKAPPEAGAGHSCGSFIPNRSPSLDKDKRQRASQPGNRSGRGCYALRGSCRGKKDVSGQAFERSPGVASFVEPSPFVPFAQKQNVLSDLALPLVLPDPSPIPSETSFGSPPHTRRMGSFRSAEPGSNEGSPNISSVGATPIKPPLESMHSLNTGTQSAASDLRKALPRPPPSLHRWVGGMVDVAMNVWRPLGFFCFRLSEPNPVLGGEYAPVAASPGQERCQEDTECFLNCLEHFYHHTIVEKSYCHDELEFIRNGLWRLLFNAVLYCISALHSSPHPCARSELPTEAGGIQAGWRVASSADVSSPGQGTLGQSRSTVPVPLAWLEEGADALEGRVEQQCAGVARTPLPVLDWYWLIRSLAQLGYLRDLFYAQTPTQASPHELLLAMLWLTRRYQLLAVVEHVELNRRYPFLLCHHSIANNTDTASATPEQEQLLFSFPKASASLPTNYDAAIARRRDQIDCIIGSEKKSTSATSPASQSMLQSGASQGKMMTLRRLMALQRLTQLSLNRLEHMQQQRNELITALGLHSFLDVELCRRDHHSLYTKVIEGLRHLATMEGRVRQRAASLADAGLLVSFALSHGRLPFQLFKEDVVESLEEDAEACWSVLDVAAEAQGCHPDRHPEGSLHASSQAQRAMERAQLRHARGCGEATHEEAQNCAQRLDSALSRFRAARVKQHLTDIWKSMVRKNCLGSTLCSSKSADLSAFERSTLLQSYEAQEGVECRVLHHLYSHYSLHAALAAELLLLRSQPHCDFSCSETRGGDLGLASFASCSGFQTHEAAKTSLPSGPGAAALPLAVSFSLTTSALARYEDLGRREAAHGGVWVGRTGFQLAEVGSPRHGATTTASLEIQRLSEVLDKASAVTLQQWDACRSRYREALGQLTQIYGIRAITTSQS